MNIETTPSNLDVIEALVRKELMSVRDANDARYSLYEARLLRILHDINQAALR